MSCLHYITILNRFKSVKPSFFKCQFNIYPLLRFIKLPFGLRFSTETTVCILYSVLSSLFRRQSSYTKRYNKYLIAQRAKILNACLSPLTFLSILPSSKYYLRALCMNTVNLWSLRGIGQKVSRPYKTSKVIVFIVSTAVSCVGEGKQEILNY